jgi:hypothetical protein
MTISLIIRMKNGDTVTIQHAGTMDSFLHEMSARGAVVGDGGTWLPIGSISHIVPQMAPQLGGEHLTQIRPEGETKQ